MAGIMALSLTNLVGFGGYTAAGGGYDPINGLALTQTAYFLETGTTQSPTNGKKMTVCGWVKTPQVAADHARISVEFSDPVSEQQILSIRLSVYYNNSNEVQIYMGVETTAGYVETYDSLIVDAATPIFLYAACDTTQATESDRVKLYYAPLGGEIAAATIVGTPAYPSLNYDLIKSTVLSTDYYFIFLESEDNDGGIIGNVVVIDGAVYTPQTFCNASPAGPLTDFVVTYGNKGAYYAVASDGTKLNDSSGNGHTLDDSETTLVAFEADWIT